MSETIKPKCEFQSWQHAVDPIDVAAGIFTIEQFVDYWRAREINSLSTLAIYQKLIGIVKDDVLIRHIWLTFGKDSDFCRQICFAITQYHQAREDIVVID